MISFDSGYIDNSSPTTSLQSQLTQSARTSSETAPQSLDIDLTELDRISSAPVSDEEQLRIQEIRKELEQSYQAKQHVQIKGKNIGIIEKFLFTFCR
jgi:hypothetical protein